MMSRLNERSIPRSTHLQRVRSRGAQPAMAFFGQPARRAALICCLFVRRFSSGHAKARPGFEPPASLDPSDRKRSREDVCYILKITLSDGAADGTTSAVDIDSMQAAAWRAVHMRRRHSARNDNIFPCRSFSALARACER